MRFGEIVMIGLFLFGMRISLSSEANTLYPPACPITGEGMVFLGTFCPKIGLAPGLPTCQPIFIEETKKYQA
jgi:hypothetical protein